MADFLVEIIDNCRKGDHNAFAQMVSFFQRQSYDLALSIVRDKHLAEDIVQQSFLTAFAKIEALRDTRAFAGWFRQIVRHTAIRSGQKSKRNSAELLDQHKIENQTPLANAQHNEMLKIIRNTLDKLPKKQKETAKLFYLDQMTHQQVANSLDVPNGTVKRRLFDARKTMRSLLTANNELFDENEKDNILPL